MGVIEKVSDKVSSLLPTRRERRDARNDLPPVGAEVLALRDNLDGWLQRFFDEPWGFPAVGDFQLVPSTSVYETDDAVVVTVEVPGLDRSDIDLTLRGNALIIRGEKREQREDNPRNVHVSERRYGTYVRTIPLPDNIDVDHAEARVEHGVLTVRFPKLQPARGERRRVEIRT
jgi:HSP20 family protein